MLFTSGQILTVVTIIGSALTIWWNLHKLGENVKRETAWRTSINIDMKNLLGKVNELLNNFKTTDAAINELKKGQVIVEKDIEAIHKEIKTIWKRTDEHLTSIKNIQHQMTQCPGCSSVKKE